MFFVIDFDFFAIRDFLMFHLLIRFIFGHCHHYFDRSVVGDKRIICTSRFDLKYIKLFVLFLIRTQIYNEKLKHGQCCWECSQGKKVSFFNALGQRFIVCFCLCNARVDVSVERPRLTQ